MTLIVTSVVVPGDPSTLSNNNTSFRSFVTSWTTIFSQSGWINTNASGSINTSSTAASTVGGISGYQVWRFNDELHNSGYPVYIKIEYGNPGTAWDEAGFWINVGPMHNGSGSISPTGANGVGSTPRGVGVTATGDGTGAGGASRTVRTSCISGSDFVGILGENSNSAEASFFCVERTKDINGNPTNEGIVVMHTNASKNNFRSSYWGYNYTSNHNPTQETYPNYILSRRYAIHDSNLTIGMLIPMVASSFGYPSRMLGLVQQSGLASQSAHQLNLFGTSSTYWVSSVNTANNTTLQGRASGGAFNFRWIMRYE